MKRLIASFLFALATPAFAFNTVVIDAGHGGHDVGGIPGQRVVEKNLTLDMAKRVRTLLREDGLKTVMTRSDDTFVSLPDRVKIANAQRNAIFVSIHFNSATRKGADGIETYYYRPASESIADKIQTRLLKVESPEDRGVKQRGYYVLRKTKIPAVLVECGFLTNRQEAAQCSDPVYRQQMAVAIVRALKASQPGGITPKQAASVAAAR